MATKPAGIDTERNYATVTVGIRDADKKIHTAVAKAEAVF